MTIASTGSVFFTTGIKYTGVMTHTSGKVLGLIDIDWPPVPSQARFDGVNEFVELNAVRTALATTTVGTWAIWVKLVDATPATATALISFSDTDAGNDLLFFIRSDVTGILQMRARTAAAVQFSLDTDAIALSDNVWAHVAIVHDGTSPVLYVNGVAVAQTFSVSTNKTYWFNNLSGLIDNGRIAARETSSGGNTLFINGSAGYCTFWNTNLSAAQITTLYNSGQAILPIANLPAYANVVSHFNMGLGDTFPTLTDDVGGNNGTMTNQEASDIIIINRTVFSAS